MKIFEPIFIDVIKNLLACDVKFLLIGGYAVNYYGYGRYTGDIDFWIKPDNTNKENFVQALKRLKRNPDDIAEIIKLDFLSPQVISIGEIPLRVDFLTKVNMLNFDEAWQQRKTLSLHNISLPLVDYHHLILTKINTGRPKDMLDIEELQKINQLKS